MLDRLENMFVVVAKTAPFKPTILEETEGNISKDSFLCSFLEMKVAWEAGFIKAVVPSRTVENIFVCNAVAKV